MGPLARGLIAAVLASALPALACEYPDEGDMPLRRAVARVQGLPETEAWRKALRDNVQYVLRLEDILRTGSRCYWTLDAMGDGRLWQRFYVSPDGKSLLAQDATGMPIPLERWRRKTGSAPD